MSKSKQKKGTIWTVLTIVLAVLTLVSAVAIPVTGYFAPDFLLEQLRK